MLSVSAENDGDIAQSVVNEDGTAYSTYAPSNVATGNDLTGCEFTEGLSVQNAPSFVTASLTGTKMCLATSFAMRPTLFASRATARADLTAQPILQKCLAIFHTTASLKSSC